MEVDGVMSERSELTILTNMCMIYDNQGHILVQNRQNKVWSGVTFPGGHVEKNESFVASVIREVREETGLIIQNLQICGTKQFFLEDGTRYIVFLYKTNCFSGELHDSREGKVFWIKAEDLQKYDLPEGFAEMYRIFVEKDINECFYPNSEKEMYII